MRQWKPPSPIARWFTFEHLPEAVQAESRLCTILALAMDKTLDRGAELSAGLRHLLEAKDCFVRARILTNERIEGERLVAEAVPDDSA